jgi:hypothetical protein
MRVFAEDLRRHLAGRPCTWAAGRPHLPVPDTQTGGFR